MWKDSEAEIDFLDYDYLVQSMNSIILDDSLLPASIGLYGDWGSGKSTLIHMSKSLLEEKNPRIKWFNHFFCGMRNNLNQQGH